jgi:hypothetical protein
MTIAKNTAVKIKHTDMTGVAIGAAINDDGQYLVCVEYTDLNGETQARYFEEEQLVV